jgi:hypothetical protein
MNLGVILFLDPMGELAVERVQGTQIQFAGQELVASGAKEAFYFSLGLGCGLHPMRTNQNGFSPSPTHFTRGEDDALS